MQRATGHIRALARRVVARRMSVLGPLAVAVIGPVCVALPGMPAAWRAVIAAALVGAGVVTVLVAAHLRRMVRLDAERLETIVALHREVERAEFDVEDVVLDVLERARTLLGATAASAGVIEGESIVYSFRTGPGRGGPPIVTPLGESLSGICARTGEVVYCADSERDERTDKAACRAQGLRSMIIAPMRHRREVVGLLNVNAPEVAAFGPNDTRTVELIAGAISAAYGHAVDMAAKRKLLDELEGTVSALRDSEAKLSYQALHDPLTGLPNRTLFLERLRTALAQRSDPEVAVLFVDLDGFKPVNDSLGHEAGDQLLCEAARRIEGVLREHDTAGRLGGDEFAIMCRDAPDARAASTVAQRLLDVLESPFELGGRDVFITASVGIAAHGGAADVLLRDADIAMYCAKAAGKAHYRTFDTSMREEADARLRQEPVSAPRAAAHRREAPVAGR